MRVASHRRKRIFYHGTSQEAWNVIKRNGLTTGGLTTDKKRARFFAGNKGGLEGKGVLLQVLVPAKMQDKFKIHSRNEIHVLSGDPRIPAKNITLVEKVPVPNWLKSRSQKV